MVLLKKMNVVTNEELENHIEKQVAKRLSENIEFLSEQTDKGSVKMPVICRFYGIIIKMYFNDHLPPHLHAIYGEYNGVIDLNNFEMIEGDLPTRALKLVQEWTKEYQTELLRMWESKNFIKLPELR